MALVGLTVLHLLVVNTLVLLLLKLLHITLQALQRILQQHLAITVYLLVQ
jgi:hypothetical protein